MANYEQNFIELQAVVKEVGQMLLEYWPGNKAACRDLEIQNKSNNSPVTAADLESSQILTAALKRLYPDYAVISEEDDAKMSRRAEKVWIIDPLDGTKSFINGKDDFSILLAEVHNEQVHRAIMYFPATGMHATAIKGQGAIVNGEKIAVSHSGTAGRERVYVRNLKISDVNFYPKQMDSGRALLAVARGEFDGAIIAMGRHNEWDLAAPSLVIAEAGGKVSDQLDQEVHFNQNSINYTYFIASNKSVHRELLDFVEKDQGFKSCCDR